MSPALPGERPEHPDFWLISQAVIDLDAQADNGQPVMDIVARMLDPDSAAYAAFQRALRFSRAVRSGTSPPQELARLGGLWLDGLVTGMIVQHLKTKGGQASEPAD